MVPKGSTACLIKRAAAGNEPLGCQADARGYIARISCAGGVAEWLKAHAWKACIRETVSWVRIPLPPPSGKNSFRSTIPTTFDKLL